jgi:hypothetical protein
MNHHTSCVQRFVVKTRVLERTAFFIDELVELGLVLRVKVPHAEEEGRLVAVEAALVSLN